MAFAYFNTNLHSQANWELSTAAKKAAYKALNKKGAILR